MEKPTIFSPTLLSSFLFWVHVYIYTHSIFNVFWLEHEKTFFFVFSFSAFLMCVCILLCKPMHTKVYLSIYLFMYLFLFNIYLIHEYRHLFHNNLIYGQFLLLSRKNKKRHVFVFINIIKLFAWILLKFRQILFIKWGKREKDNRKMLDKI